MSGPLPARTQTMGSILGLPEQTNPKGFQVGSRMTEFAAEVRHYCRNPKCRIEASKAPIANTREAFCTRGCRDRFYRLRCYVCEEKKPGRLDAHTCGRRKCKNALRSTRNGPRIPRRVEIGLWKPNKIRPSRSRIRYGRAWQVCRRRNQPQRLPLRHCVRWPQLPVERRRVRARRSQEPRSPQGSR